MHATIRGSARAARVAAACSRSPGQRALESWLAQAKTPCNPAPVSDDFQRAAAHLQRLQASMYNARGLDPRAVIDIYLHDPHRVRDAITTKYGWDDDDGLWDTAMRRSIRERPTPFEHPGTYYIMSQLARDIEAACIEQGWDLPRPVLGTLPLGQFNARVMRAPGSAIPIVAFQSGVFSFVNLWTKGLATCFPCVSSHEGYSSYSTNMDDVLPALEADGTPVTCIANLLTEYVYRGDPEAAQQYLPGSESLVSSMLHRDAAELFVLGHEYGHLIAGHLDNPVDADDVMRLEPHGIDVPASWFREFEADCLGLQLGMASLNSQSIDPYGAYVGAHLLFEGVVLVDRALSTAMSGTAGHHPASSSHPPARLRQVMIRNQLPLLWDNQVERIDRVISIAADISDLTEYLWRQIQPVFAREYALGHEPASVWTA